VAVRHSRAVQRLSSAPRQAESRPGTIGPISLDVKQMGERSAGNPHAAFDVAEAGNVARHRPKLARQSSTLPVRGRPVMGVPTAIEIDNGFRASSDTGPIDRRRDGVIRRPLFDRMIFTQEPAARLGPFDL